MNNNIRIPPGLLQVGTALTHNVYDGSGKLLLRQGAVLESAAIVERLEDKGFFDPEAVDALKSRTATGPQEMPTGYVPDRSGVAFSAFAQVHAACAHLQALAAGAAEPLEPGILAIADALQVCCTIDNDASIAALFTPLPFPRPIRHAVCVALLTAMVLARRKHDPARLRPALAAALTMDLGGLAPDDDPFGPDADGQLASRLRAHPAASVEALLARHVTHPLWLAIVSQHHEAMDGSGYPAGLPGDRILPEAQMLALADRYCAMIAGGPQRPALPVTQVLRDIHGQYGRKYSPELVGALLGAVGIYPPGACVELVNREQAVVVHRLLDPKHPVVFAVCGPAGVAFEPPRKRLTASQPAYAIERCITRDAVKVAIVPEQLWPPTLAAAVPPA